MDRRSIELALTLLLASHAGIAKAAQTSSIVLSPDERTVASVAEDSGGICLWDWAGDRRVRFVPVGEEPRTLAFSPDGRTVWVACQASQALVAVDAARGETTASIPLCGQPCGVLVAPDGRRAYVSRYAGGYVDSRYHPGLVSIIDLEARRPAAEVSVRARPWAMALDAAGSTLLVTHYLNLDGRGWVTAIDPREPRVLREIPLREDDGVIDGAGGVFNALASIALHPRGNRALVAGMHANVRRGSALSGQPLSHKTTVQAAVRVLDLEASAEIHEARINSSFSGQAVAVPSAVAFIGATDHYIDVYFASNDFKVIRYNERGLVAERALRSLPAGPKGAAVTADGKTAFFDGRWSRSISRFSLADLRDPVLVETVRAGPEPWDERRLRGAVLFHDSRDTRMTANRWLSCGACHLDGGIVSDGLVWDLTVPGAVPKIGKTMDLVRTAASAPPFFHRGSGAVVEDLERFVLHFCRGTGFLDGSPAGASGEAASPEWEAMAAFMAGLRPRPSPHLEGGHPRPEIRAAAERGRAIFLDPARRCVDCHDGPALTASGRPGRPSVFDVGTGKEVDTPSLLHLWDAAPYLHDGRAATLLEVLTVHNREDLHGKTSDLDARGLEDLATYLLVPDPEERP